MVALSVHSEVDREADDGSGSWWNKTFNPWWGCTKVSPGCTNCYAETVDATKGPWRARQGGLPEETTHWGTDVPRLFQSESYWKQPEVWNRKAARESVRLRVFCASMGDVFEDRDDLTPHRERLWRLIQTTPHLDWMMLTKRPEGFSKLLPWRGDEAPWRNVWLGVTAENQEWADRRIPILVSTPAHVRFISYEPALGALDISPYLRTPYRAGLDWVIVGDEDTASSKARPTEVAWVRSVRDQCLGRAVAFHFKQWAGAAQPGISGTRGKRGKIHLPKLDDNVWAEFPDDGEHARSSASALVDTPNGVGNLDGRSVAGLVEVSSNGGGAEKAPSTDTVSRLRLLEDIARRRTELLSQLPPIHPAAAAWPSLADNELAELIEDIQRHGQRVPCTRHEGTILDGRHRELACKFLGVAAATVEWKSIADSDSPWAYVWSLNARRRELTAGQKAVLYLDIFAGHERWIAERAAVQLSANVARSDALKDRVRKPNGTLVASQGSRDPSPARGTHKVRVAKAKDAGVSPGTIARAEELMRKAPQLFEAVKSGKKTIGEAKKELTHHDRRDVTTQAVGTLSKLKRSVAMLHARIVKEIEPLALEARQIEALECAENLLATTRALVRIALIDQEDPQAGIVAAAAALKTAWTEITACRSTSLQPVAKGDPAEFRANE